MPKPATSNRLLAALTHDERALFDPCLESVEIGSGDLLAEPYVPAKYAYFLDQGMAATVLGIKSSESVEVGLTGNEGFIGLPIILDVHRCPRKTTVLMGGMAHRVASTALLGLTEAVPTIRSKLLNYVHSFIIQMSSTILAHASLKIEQKLARWLLMAQDRMGDELILTHGFLSVVLGVRRPGVTNAIHVLEGGHCIKAHRSRITILDRDKLQALAGNSYGIAEAEFDRVFGPREASLPLAANT